MILILPSVCYVHPEAFCWFVARLQDRFIRASVLWTKLLCLSAQEVYIMQQCSFDRNIVQFYGDFPIPS